MPYDYGAKPAGITEVDLTGYDYGRCDRSNQVDFYLLRIIISTLIVLAPLLLLVFSQPISSRRVSQFQFDSVSEGDPFNAYTLSDVNGSLGDLPDWKTHGVEGRNIGEVTVRSHGNDGALFAKESLK